MSQGVFGDNFTCVVARRVRLAPSDMQTGILDAESLMPVAKTSQQHVQCRNLNIQGRVQV